jgi:hypothetical protein
MTGDISGYLFDRRQAYTSVRLQQGRVITDLDWNENERIEADEKLRLLADLVCGHGSTNDGFRLLGAAPATIAVPSGGNGLVPRETYDVTLAGGTFLLGGNLHAWPDRRPDGSFPQTFLDQDDWLQVSGVHVAALPPAPDADRTDLVYLEAFEHPVRAVEDRELRERALGGPDTSTRLKAIRRVSILPGVSGGCSGAAAILRERATEPAAGDTSGNPHGFDATLCEVRSKARLTVGFTGSGPTLDPCKPRVTQGYLGAENQSIRVQLTAANRFLWAYDNGEPLYRVEISDATLGDDGSIELTFLTTPPDPVLFPLQGVVVEILPWGALLANREKVAEARGHLARATASYDPGSHTLRIAPAVPVEMQEWQNASERDDILNPLGPDDPPRYFYARIWQPGPQDSADLDHPFTPGTEVPLPGTGLGLTFGAFGLPGDYWIIAARPNTPDRVVPWRLLEEAAPFGPRRFYAPLGLVRWTAGVEGELAASVEDCRHRFRKLCEVESCCTVHVGDGSISNGQVNGLQAAIDLVPPEGGQICLLPGTHLAAAVIAGRQNIVIQGCGPRTRVVSDMGQNAPVIDILRSQNITLRDFAIGSDEALPIRSRSARELRLERLSIRSRDRAAVIATQCEGFQLVESMISQADLPSFEVRQNIPQEPAVFVAGERLRVVRNQISALATARASLSGLGGLQIGGNSLDVAIEDNLIEGGNGAGIVLGSVDFQPRPVLARPDRLQLHYATHVSLPTYSSWLSIADNDCLTIDPRPQPQPDPNQPDPLDPVSDGPVVDCRILDNRIRSMGASGITVAFWFAPDDEGDSIVTDRLRIEGNTITECMRLPVGTIPPELAEIAAFGGITLATGADIVIRDNRISNVGTSHPSPIVGIYVLDGEALAIERNQLRDNGQIATLQSTIPIGRVGGIVIGLVRPAVDFFAPFGDQVQARQDGAPALVVASNVAVAREGRALSVIGVGPMFVHGNNFIAHGSNSLRRVVVGQTATNSFGVAPLAANGLQARAETQNPLTAFLDTLGGAAIAMLNLGLSNELYLQLLGFSGLGQVDPQQPPDTQGFDDDIKLLANGNILFNDNQVVFDSLSPAVTLTLSAVLLMSLDDVAMEDNQCDCDELFDIVAVNALVLGFSVRVQGNRMKESLFTTLLSAMTIGLFNDTSHNQGTHCFFHYGALEPRIALTGAPPGLTATLDTNRHLVPEARCTIFRGQTDNVAVGVGAPVATTFG